MVCTYCSGELAVSNSRPQKSRNQTWRRRLCKRCGAVFTSIEAIDLSQALTVVRAAHKPAQLQPFDRDRLFISIYESLRHRSAAASEARALTDTVLTQLIKQSERGSVTIKLIAETTLNTLQRFDAAAASHYAAFHPL